jgi:hypothetical protein
MMREQIEVTESSEQGKGYDAVLLPLMLLAGALGLSVFLVWFVYLVLYFLFIMGFMVSMFGVVMGSGG